MDFRTPTTTGHHTTIITVASDDGRPFLDSLAYARLARLLAEAAQDEQTRVVVLRGLAGCFCLGGDFGEFLDTQKHPDLIAAVTDLFRTLVDFPKPILACVDGDAVGVGCTILFHCDVVIASPRSTFRVPFVDFGLVPDAATSILAPDRMGYGRAFRFFCLGETLDAENARAFGLVHVLSNDDDVETVALGTARTLAKKPQRALLLTRALLRGDSGLLCERIDREISLFHAALQDESTIRRLTRLARMAA